MALPSSGQISLNQMHVEAGGSSGTQAGINDADIRALIGKGSGVQMAFNEWYGAFLQDVNIAFNGGTSVTTGKFGNTRTGVTPSTFTPTIGSWTDKNVITTAGIRTFNLILSQNGGTLPSNTVALLGNFNGQTFQQVTGYNFLKFVSNSAVFVKSSAIELFTGNQVTGVYVASQGHTVFTNTHNGNGLSYYNISGSQSMFLSN